jgi:sigma-E factor negative regulatory protein RseB
VGNAIQLSYSDGVMTVSMFEQAGTLDPDRLDGYAMREVAGGAVYSVPGPPARFTWSTGKHVITVVSEAPQEVVEALVRAVPPEELSRPAADDGVLARIARGARRVGSWLNPFD